MCLLVRISLFVSTKLYVRLVIPTDTPAIQEVNRSTEIWGPDAGEFNPYRFDRDGIPAKHVSGVYGNLLSFLGGARNCMYVPFPPHRIQDTDTESGYRFAIAEMKAGLFALLRRLEFEALPSNPRIIRKLS
jgi:cytochrome P450